MISRGLGNALGHELHLTADQIGKGRGAALVGDMHQVHARCTLEHLGHQMADATVAGRAKIDLARIGLGIGNQLLQILGRHLVVDQQGQRLHGSTRNGSEVLERAVGQLAVERGLITITPVLASISV